MVISKFLKLVRAFVSRIYITIQEMSNNNTIQLNELHSTPPLMGLMKVKRRSVILNETLLRPNNCLNVYVTDQVQFPTE